MSKLKVYCVYDSKVNSFAQPFFMRTRGEAIRSWQEVANDSTTQIYKHAEDFALMELGEYNEDTGTFENAQAPLNLGLASQFKKPTAAKTMGDWAEDMQTQAKGAR